MDSRLLIGTWKGIESFRPEGKGWKANKPGLTNFGVFDLATSPEKPNRVFAGTRGDGVWVSEDRGETWRLPNRGKPGPKKVRCLAIDPSNPDRIYAGTEPIALWVSDDAGVNWHELPQIWDLPGIGDISYPGNVIEPHVRDITIHPKHPKTIYASLQVGSMIKSTDGGQTWRRMLNKEVDADIHTILLRDDDPNHIYVTTGGGDGRKGIAPGRSLYESLNGGENWRPIAMEIELDYSVPLAAHPKNPDILYSALASSTPRKWKNRDGGARAELIRSKNGGVNWETVETGFAEMHKDYPMAIAFDPVQPDKVFVATRYGHVFASEDGGRAWSDLGIRVAEVTEMRVLTA